MKYLVIVSEFNSMITEPMLEKSLLGFEEQNIKPEVIKVPGALEIPFAIQKYMEKEKYDAIVALGCLIKGETDHYDAICQMVNYGTMRLSLDYKVPIIFEVLMTDTYQKAEERIDKAYHASFLATKMSII